MHEPGQIEAILLAMILLMIICGIVPLVVVAGWMWSFGGRVRRGGRFPPIDAKRWKNSRVLDGAAARSRGAVFRTGAIAIFVVAIGSTWGLWRLWVALT